jgi:hypothetical protein
LNKPTERLLVPVVPDTKVSAALVVSQHHPVLKITFQYIPGVVVSLVLKGSLRTKNLTKIPPVLTSFTRMLTSPIVVARC